MLTVARVWHLQSGGLRVQVAHRLVAVEVARLLLAELPDPYSASSVILPGSLPAPSTTARVSSNRRIAAWTATSGVLWRAEACLAEMKAPYSLGI